ncbi:hypothetical protein UY3_07117 [Chelonia mydas]|uniref:Uncharacterized protein n=1 Tax=Chelonia mydas TaxID=8469 RepID=M7BJ49_CHEMY|nr:hypothetical protein UY3_07117 [Chelonia mydas]
MMPASGKPFETRSGAHLPTVYRVSRKFHWSLLNLRGSSSTPSQHIGKVDSEMVENAAKHTPLPKVFTYRISAAMKATESKACEGTGYSSGSQSRSAACSGKAPGGPDRFVYLLRPQVRLIAAPTDRGSPLQANVGHGKGSGRDTAWESPEVEHQ